jgi:hypothetical protein
LAGSGRKHKESQRNRLKTKTKFSILERKKLAFTVGEKVYNRLDCFEHAYLIKNDEIRINRMDLSNITFQRIKAFCPYIADPSLPACSYQHPFQLRAPWKQKIE